MLYCPRNAPHRGRESREEIWFGTAAKPIYKTTAIILLALERREAYYRNGGIWVRNSGISVHFRRTATLVVVY